ncbi:PREDICTED: retinitis pigmentosa 1-like 1 protein [Cyprinodon variegatus]|uniref:retinitis pigmentosa 1-like 1 protein n=1 Tax=Cyprinodon variegatus TaxID=28743 RepID=UPI000742A80E|nr:PREDICTED: retinitis pigmentosa 1-like 1 protein [Cyprinodon variegatus]
MSCHKHNFHCFTAVGGEDSHKSSVPFEHHTPWLPRIPQHGMVAYQELEHGCCLCSAYQQAQTLEAVENQLLPFYHPYHNHPPHQYVLRGPSMHERTHSAKESNIHHRIHDKKIVLVKNSDPSFRKTISLHSKGLHSFGLFLKEVSELMEYHVRKLYTQEGFKIDSIQSLLQCPGVLVCVGREPSHPMIMENFEKTSSNKLPRLSGKSRTTEPTDGDERITAKTNITLPNLEDVNRGTKYSVSSDKSAPDGRDSPEIVNSCPASGDSREDDIEKWVRVNKDGSLSMEMKVRFRLPNDKILHWSTKVKKTAGQNNDQIKGHNNPNLAHIGDVSCSESEITSTDEAFFTQHVLGHREKPHCPYCCSHCQGYETWKNVIGKHGASRCSHSSSSSASSHTVVSRKTVIKRQTMSRSSEEHADQLAPPVRHESEEDVEQQAEDDLEPRTQSLLSALSSESADLKGITQETSEEEDNQNTGEEIESNSSKKTNVTNVSTAITVSENTGKSSRTNASRGQVAGDEGICPNRHPVVCHTDSAESDLSQTLSGSEIMKEICENSSPGESRSHGSKRKANSAMDATEAVSNKSNKGSKDRKNDMDNGDFELVPSILPNASPTEVVNEWLKTLPTDRDHYEMEELHENDDSVKDIGAAERDNGEDDAEKNKSDAQILKEANCPIEFQKEDCKTSTEAPKEESSSTHRGDGSKMFNSIQVMKVLLNPKLDRCNSLPEISPVHGRKLSTSAKGLLDCLVKLRLIQHDPENANEKDERYQELMSILQSLWLSNPDEKKHAPNMNNHNSLEGEHNHTSSSGVDVNSGSTGSGKSSDGVKSCSEPNVDGSQTQNSLITMEKAHTETSTKWKQDAEKAEQEEEDSATDETITSNDSPGEPPETPASSSKSSGESSGNDKNLSRKLSQDPDPVWVLTLLNKIEKQFMTHYLSAMKELKLRWSLEDTDQLDKMIDELKIEVQNKIQTSIDKEIRKIQGRVGLPRPPTEAISRVSTKQTEERRQRLKIKLQSTDSQAEKSDSTTGTSYSDQRADNIDEYCPCETCMEKNVNSRQPLSVEVKRTAPVAIDYDLKRILLMKTTADGADPHVNDKDTKVKTLVEQVIVGAIREVESEKSVAFSNTEVLNEEESEQEERYVLVKEASSEKLEADREGAKKDWSKLKRKLLPSVRIVLQGKMKQQSTTDAANNEKVTINESDQSEEEDSEAKMTAEQETKVLIKNRSSEEADHGEAVDKHPAFEVSVAQMTDVKSNKEKEVEIDKESLSEITSNAALSEDEKAAIETSSITTSGHECEKDKTVVTLTEQKSDTEEASEGTGTTSDHDSVGESGGTSDGNETEDEEEATFDDLSSIQEEEETEDELSVKREAELKKSQIPAALYENRKEKGEAKPEVQTSEREEVKEKSIVSGEHTISPVNSGDSPDENEAAESESDEEDTTENEVPAAQVYRGSLTKSGDKTKETKRAASKHKSEKGAEGEEGTGTDEENLPAVSANESDGNRDSSTEDETSEEQNKGTTTGDENISEEETALRQNGKSKDQIAKDETAAEGTENEVSEDERTIDDGEQTGTAGESDSAEDVNDITTDDDDDDDDDESAEENDGICGELSIKQPENENKKYKQAGDEATVTATSEQQSEKIDNAEEEEAFSCEEESFKVKNRLALALTSETANDSEENKIDTDATHESDKDAVGGATGKQESETEDEPNKEKEDRLKEENTMDGTDTEEEDTGQSKSDSADALSNDETSATETKHKINKAYNALNEKEPEKRRDGDNHDVSGDTDQGSTTESSSKAVTENESEEEGSISATDDENSDNNLGEDTDETAGQEDTSTVKGYDDLGDKNLEAKCNDEILDETSQEYTDEKESLGHVEPVEQLLLAKGLLSSRKMEDSTAENQSIKDDTSNVGTCPEESESFANESESESKQEHFSEAISKAHEDNKTTVEDSSKIEKFGSKGIETNNGEKSRSKDEEDALDKAYSEEATDEEEDGSVEEKEPKCIESEEKKSSTLNRKTDQKSIKDYEKEDEDTDTPHEGWNGSLGDSADGEDEAEEDSEPEEDLIDRKKPFVADKLENLDTTKKDAKKTLLDPLEALMKERAESEDGAYADIEDSETEIHDQGDVPSIESKF